MSNKTPIIIFGSGSQARYVIDNAASTDQLILGLVDVEEGKMVGEVVNGVSVNWTLNTALKDIGPSDGRAVIAHGNNAYKLSIASTLAAAGFTFISSIHDKAIISPSSEICNGAIINAGAIILPNAHIGEHVMVHSGCVIEHDCRIGAGANLAPGAVMAGRVTVGSEAYLLTGCSIGANMTIGDRGIVRAGAVVIRDVAEDTEVMGVPAKPVIKKDT